MPQESKHILFLSPWYPDKFDPMPGLFVRRHAMAVANFCEVATLHVKAYKQQAKTEKVWHEEFIPELYYYSHKSRFQPINYFRFVLHHIQGFLTIKKKWRKLPDIIHVNILTREGVMALMFKFLFGIPYVVTEHWSRYGNPESYKGIVRKYLTQLVLNHASALMPVTQNLREKMSWAGLDLPTHIEVVPNVVNTSRFVPDSKKHHQKIRFIHISCFDEKAKNVKGILRVIKSLLEETQDFEFKIVGDGPDYDEVKAYSDWLEIPSEIVEYKGLMEGDDLIHEIQQADAHVMFSNYENLPVVNLECFACGVPVISSDVGGIHEFFNTDLGVLVEPGNEEALKKVLLRLVNKELTFNSEIIREYAINNFSEERVGQKIVNVYNQVLPGL